MDPLTLSLVFLVGAIMSDCRRRISLGGRSTTKQKLATLKAAASHLYEKEPDLVEGGCADVSGILKAFADSLGWSGVTLTGCTAERKGSPQGPFWHAWLMVDGYRFDPVMYARGQARGLTYTEDPGGFAMVAAGSYCEPEGLHQETLPRYVDELRRALGVTQ